MLTLTGSMSDEDSSGSRYSRVLFAGGSDTNGTRLGVDLYDPSMGQFVATDSLPD